LEKRGKTRFDILVFLQCTSPLTLPEDIDGIIKSLVEHKGDSALTVTPFHFFLWEIDEHGRAEGVNHDKGIRKMRQEGSSSFLETGSVYAMKIDNFKKAGHRFFGKIVTYPIPAERCLEIDEPHDLMKAETLLRKRMDEEKRARLPARIQAVVFDFDGVFTDNRVLVQESGIEGVTCDRSDGFGISLLKKSGIPILVLSQEQNAVVAVRCQKLGVPYSQGIEEKWNFLRQWFNQKTFTPENVVYVGNDLNDKECLQAVGCGVIVYDAHKDIRGDASIILSQSGGRGAVREICDLIMKRNASDLQRR